MALNTTVVIETFLVEVEKRAYRMAYYATGNREEALDIVQDAMFKLVKRYRDRNEKELTLLFHRILQNQIRDWYRRSKVRRSVLVVMDAFGRARETEQAEPVEHMGAARHLQPPEQLANEQAMAGLDEAVSALPLRQQQAFLLRTLEGLDVSQAAQVMGCSQGSVKTHLSRAIHSLREKLGEYDLP